ncbi:MAG: GtrA family protein [Paludibacter sp.]|jgi:putative flippase GtrA|nr:GtrA family protein [Paludibacter sp.]
MRNSFYKLFKVPTKNAYIQLFRYCFSGGIAFVVDFCILFLLTEYFAVHYLLAASLGFLAGLIITYLLSVFWIFDERRVEKKTLEITIFVTIGLVGLLLTSAFMWLFTSVLLLHYLFSKILTTGIVMGWNFVAKKFILFSK